MALRALTGYWNRTGRPAALSVLAAALFFVMPPFPGAAGEPGAAPELWISEGDLQVSNASPLEGQLVLINVTARLNATEPEGTVTGELVIDDRLEKIFEIPVDPGIAFLNRSFEWRARGGRHRIGVLLDPADQLRESNESNNQATVFIRVRALPPSPAGLDWCTVASAAVFMSLVALAGALLFQGRKRPAAGRDGPGTDELASARKSLDETALVGADMAGAEELLEQARRACEAGDYETGKRHAMSAVRKAESSRKAALAGLRGDAAEGGASHGKRL